MRVKLEKFQLIAEVGIKYKCRANIKMILMKSGKMTWRLKKLFIQLLIFKIVFIFSPLSSKHLNFFYYSSPPLKVTFATLYTGELDLVEPQFTD